MGWRSGPRGRHRGAGDPRPHPLHLLPGRLHAEPRDPLRAHLLDRHPGGRRDRRGREHRAASPREAGPSPSLRVAVEAVDEVGNPTILATFTVIAAILPMAFVRGLMGPYMRPIPTGASAAMLFSLAVAFIVSPWAAYRIFRHHDARPRRRARDGGRGHAALPPGHDRARHAGPRCAGPSSPASSPSSLASVGHGRRWASCKVKMLPFDNKSELQVLVDHDEGTPARGHARDGARR